MTRVGLVLGAGGVVGQAFHAGVLAALEHDLSWDPRDVEVIVGTSAGAITGSLLRAGVPASELAAWTVRAPLSAEGEVLNDAFGSQSPLLEPLQLADLARFPSLPRRPMLQRALARPWRFRPLPAALALMGAGHRDVRPHVEAVSQLTNDDWPARDLWLCAVRRRDGARVVFGRPGTHEAPLHLAVAASCSVPGYFAPVTIGEDSYIDGGAHSPTNAGVLRPRSLDLVIIVSPMSGPGRLPRDPASAARWHAARLVHREARTLRARGTSVVVFAPGREEQAVMGNDLMSRSRVDEVVQASFLGAGAHAARTEVRRLFDR